MYAVIPGNAKVHLSITTLITFFFSIDHSIPKMRILKKSILNFYRPQSRIFCLISPCLKEDWEDMT